MKNRWYRWTFIVAAVVVLVFGLRSCFSGDDLISRDPGEEIDAELTLRTVTLEQPDEDGTLLWRLKAESVTYVPDTQRANLVALEGEFFQDAEVVYTVEADEGEVLQNGNTLFLRGNLVATGRENDLTLEGEKLKWQPKQDLLVMGAFDESESSDSGFSSANSDDSGSDDSEDETAESFLTIDDAPVTGFNPQLKTAARLVRVNNREDRVELVGGVLAQSKEEPWVTFASESLTWRTERELIEASQPLTVEQYENDAYQTVTDRLVGGSGQVELAENRVTLEEEVQLDALTQPLTVISEQAVWDIDAQTVDIDSMVDIEQPEDEVTAVANQARLDLAAQVIYLEGDVQAISEKNDAQLDADRVVWQTETQLVEAIGNVRYQQADDPDVEISGPRATGDIEAGTLVIEGGESGEVVTEIVPDGL
ncbi:MAG: LPS export ABC transporter periplasmic protein LptC [Cyanobacteria bacterium J06629_19]